ncbi:D-alanyl-D-alanine carboxypeptidase family protein [Limosilactobacillus difficilis]|uniref:D-alanyl-D-alanine carboxypeptidase family protein n=1 Tax=Limosilactobacillus difficilis TaxID=2991838 RepID=UPI0024B8984B|nr:serine hydrolase [Limosilactobacillus difficilis]
MRLHHSFIKAATIMMVALSFTSTVAPATALAAKQSGNTVTNTSTRAKKGQHVQAKAAVTIDAKTGQVLYAQNANQKMPIASVVKILTLAVIEEDINKGKLRWNTKVTISKPISKIANDWHFSNVELDEGRTYTVRDLVNSMMIVSADGSAAALAIKDAGSTAAFNKKMQRIAHKAGVRDAKIYNMIGLDNGSLGALKLKSVKKSAENQFSALDVAKISRYLVDHYPSALKITSGNHVNFRSNDHQQYDMLNINYLISKCGMEPDYGQVDGLKTGKTDKAGDCFAGTGVFGKRRLIFVVLNVPGTYNNMFTQSLAMISDVLGRQVKPKTDQNKNNKTNNGQNTASSQSAGQ